MKNRTHVIFAALLYAFMFAADQDVSVFNIPKEVDRCMDALRGDYKISGRINPFYLRGDFLGDGKSEFAVLVYSSLKQEKGIAFCGPGFAKPTILGAGSPFHEMTDLTFDAWHIYGKGPVQRGVGARMPPVLRGEALWLEWSESASGLAYWDGKQFHWYQQGD